MTERKVISKYYPPDFDPSKNTRIRPSKNKSGAAALPTVRLMSPFSMRCTACGEFIAQNRKFNARKQQTGESYLGVRIIRFYIRCPRCAGEIRFKTDPKSAGYLTEYGAVKNHEGGATNEEEESNLEESLDDRLDRLEREEREAREQDERRRMYGISSNLKDGSEIKLGDDPIADLEAQVMKAKREEQMLDELDDLRTRNARIDSAAIHGGLIDRIATQREDEKDDEELAKKAFRRTFDGTVIKEAVPAVKQPTPSVFKNLKRPKRSTNSLGIKKKSLV